MKIYTKTGDKGKTSLVGGQRVPKNHIRIEAYGTVDELMSYMALVGDLITDTEFKKIILEIQDRLMTCSSILAFEGNNESIKLPQIINSDIEFLEKQIDNMNESLDPLNYFILPGGHPVISHCHIARTICRRAERTAITVTEEFEVPENVIKYINRLSDFLFTLSRKLAKDLNIDEITWHPRL
jgi:cob(I)alamin adenosyltransferase